MTQTVDGFATILQTRSCVRAAPVFDPLSARIAELQGWQVCKLSGSVAKACELGIPDSLHMTNGTDLVDVCRRILRVADVHLIVDADDGGPNVGALWRLVRELESAGVAAIELEDSRDRVEPGSELARHSEFADVHAQVERLHAALAARRNPRTRIVARTASLEFLAREASLERIRAYSDAGVDAIMLVSLPGGRADLEEVSSVTDLPLFVLGIDRNVPDNADWLLDNNVRVRYMGQGPFRESITAIYNSLLALRGSERPLHEHWGADPLEWVTKHQQHVQFGRRHSATEQS